MVTSILGTAVLRRSRPRNLRPLQSLGWQAFGYRERRRRQTIEPQRLITPACQTLLGTGTNVLRCRQVGLACRVQASNPTPAQCVARWISIHQVTYKEISPQLPRQTQRKHPDRREPHARVIVQIPGSFQLMTPFVKDHDGRFACDRTLVIIKASRVALDMLKACWQLVLV